MAFLRFGVLCLALVGCGARSSLPVDGDGGSTSNGGAGSASGGSASGGGDVGGAGGGPCVPTEEVCNGVDDDCDGAIDEIGCVTFVNGCADQTREGFVDEDAFPDIAACSGGFQVPGLLTTLSPTCGRQGGDDSANPNGDGCAAEDLCAEGFTVCPSEQAVAITSAGSCGAVTNEPDTFFVARQSGTGCGKCANGTVVSPVCDQCSCEGNCAPVSNLANDLFGCGTAGLETTGCGGLTRFSDDSCGSLPPPWSCNAGGCDEANAVTKPGPANGGVLCCRVDAL